MKEAQDREQVERYLRVHRIETVFSEQIQHHLSLKCFERGEHLCDQGDTPHDLYVLVKGRVKVYTTSAEGKTLILSFKSPLELIGDIEYVRGTEIVNTVEAVSAVDVLAVPYRWLRKYGQSDPQLLQFLLDHITRKFYVKSHAMSFNLMYPVEVRLASYLLSVSLEEGNAEQSEPLNQETLMDAANLLGTSYRHLNRVLQQFCAEGLIERSKGGVLVKNRDGLSRRAGQNIFE